MMGEKKKKKRKKKKRKEKKRREKNITCSSSRWISSLNDQISNDSMERKTIIVTIETMLDKISACFWRFFSPKFNVKGPCNCEKGKQ